MLPDYYSILGVARDASYLAIKAAYRSLAKEYHPDLYGGDKKKERIFKQINEAYSVLSDTDARMAYDNRMVVEEQRQQTGHTPQPPPVHYRPAARQPYHYAPRSSPYTSIKYVYSKWTLMYGKIFVVGLIMFALLMPVYLEYAFSNYYYKKGVAALAIGDYYEADNNFSRAMRDLGGSNTQAAIKGAEMKLSLNANFEALSYIKAGLKFAETTPQHARLYYLYGRASSRVHHMQDACDAFDASLKFGYSKDSIYQQLAPLLTYEVKEYTRAIALYDTLMTYYPENYAYVLNRGFCYQKLDNHNLAIGDFNTFIANAGENGSVLYLKAVSQISLDEMDSACANFRKSLDLGIRNARTFIKLYCEPKILKPLPDANPY